MAKGSFVRGIVGVGTWPVRLDRQAQKVIVLGLATGDRGVTIGRLQEALCSGATLAKTIGIVDGPTHAGDIRRGRGYVDQWFTPSWIPKDCAVEKSRDYDYCIPQSRVRVIGLTSIAKSKLLEARQTVERLCLS